MKGKKVEFSYEELPHMQPIRIPTKDKGFWGAIILWIMRCKNLDNHKRFSL
jgi:hypothetical protein